MTEPNKKTKNIFIKKDGAVHSDYTKGSVVSGIKRGSLKKEDEISPDGKVWMRLDKNPNLAKLFASHQKSDSKNSPETPQAAEDKLTKTDELLKLSELLKTGAISRHEYDRLKAEIIRGEGATPESQTKKSGNIFDLMRSGVTRWVIIGVGAFLIYLWASPYLTIWKIQSAFKEKDAYALVELIDFDRVRKSVKEKANFYVMELSNAGVFDQLEKIKALGETQSTVEVYLSKAGLGKLFSADFFTPSKFKNDYFSFETKYISFSKFQLVGKTIKEIDTIKIESGNLDLERDGLDWKIVGLDVDLNPLIKELKRAKKEEDMAELSKLKLQTIHSACKLFWMRNNSQVCTMKQISDSGYGPTKHDQIIESIIDGREKSFKAKSFYLKGRETYYIDSIGNLTSEKNIPDAP